MRLLKDNFFNLILKWALTVLLCLLAFLLVDYWFNHWAKYEYTAKHLERGYIEVIRDYEPHSIGDTVWVNTDCMQIDSNCRYGMKYVIISTNN